MNLFWKELLLILVELAIVSMVLYEIIRKAREPTDRLSLLLMSVLLLVVFVHLVRNCTRMFYNFGLWFYCRS